MESNSRVVLVVEDADLCSVTLEIALLSVRGVSVMHTNSAEAAIEELNKGVQVQALITDIHLPEMDGFELVERVRQMPRLAKLPIIVISGDSDPHTPERVKRLGANAFFTKPYSPAAVRQKLEELLDA